MVQQQESAAAKVESAQVVVLVVPRVTQAPFRDVVTSGEGGDRTDYSKPREWSRPVRPARA